MDIDKCNEFPINDSTKICKLVNDKCKITQLTCEEMNVNNCRDLVLNNNKICNNELKCEEREFTFIDADINNCGSFTPNDVTKKCILKEALVEDESETPTCEEVKRECPEMYIHYCQNLVLDINKKCVINFEGNACELTNEICSDYSDSNCGNYIPLNSGMKCIKEEGEATCKEIKKSVQT